MKAPYLTGGMLVAALYIASYATALASPCADAVKNYNLLTRSGDDRFYAAFENATGIPARDINTQGGVAYCQKLLPVFRQRLRTQQAIMKAYDATLIACANPHFSDSGREGVRSSSAPQIFRTMQIAVERCERALATRHARLDVDVDVGARSCTNQLGRCITYRRRYGPTGSEGVCTRVFHGCVRSGVWDATSAFPYGGARITNMIRQ
jgi:hypothetical protein